MKNQTLATPCYLFFNDEEKKELYEGLLNAPAFTASNMWANKALERLAKPADEHFFTTDELRSLGTVAGASPLGDKITAFFIKLKDKQLTNLADTGRCK